MSHFVVAVFHEPDQDIEALLEPYYEGLEVESYIWKTKQEAIDYVREYYKDVEDKSDEECWEMIAEDEETDAEGNIYTTYNPDSKWDWFEIGGRWSGFLKRKDGEKVNSDFVKNLDFSSDKKAYEDALEYWDSYVEKGEKKEGEFYFYNREFYKKRYKDAETYAKCASSFSTRAVILPDGSWHEPGQMGWFCATSESDEEALDWNLHYKERFLDTANPDWMLTIVDCHI